MAPRLNAKETAFVLQALQPWYVDNSEQATVIAGALAVVCFEGEVHPRRRVTIGTWRLATCSPPSTTVSRPWMCRLVAQSRVVVCLLLCCRHDSIVACHGRHRGVSFAVW